MYLYGVVNSRLHPGRVKPGKFEYHKINSFITIEEAIKKCDEDLACAGFTFKGATKTLTYPMQMYFFHVIPPTNENDIPYFYWSTYKTNRFFVKLPRMQVKLKYSKKSNIRYVVQHFYISNKYTFIVKILKIST